MLKFIILNRITYKLEKKITETYKLTTNMQIANEYVTLFIT